MVALEPMWLSTIPMSGATNIPQSHRVDDEMGKYDFLMKCNSKMWNLDLNRHYMMIWQEFLLVKHGLSIDHLHVG